MTPGEYAELVTGYEWRRRQEARDRAELAWLVAALSRQKKLMPLERFLKPNGVHAVKTVEERRADYEELKQRLG